MPPVSVSSSPLFNSSRTVVILKRTPPFFLLNFRLPPVPFRTIYDSRWVPMETGGHLPPACVFGHNKPKSRAEGAEAGMRGKGEKERRHAVKY